MALAALVGGYDSNEEGRQSPEKEKEEEEEEGRERMEDVEQPKRLHDRNHKNDGFVSCFLFFVFVFCFCFLFFVFCFLFLFLFFVFVFLLFLFLLFFFVFLLLFSLFLCFSFFVGVKREFFLVSCLILKNLFFSSEGKRKKKRRKRKENETIGMDKTISSFLEDFKIISFSFSSSTESLPPPFSSEGFFLSRYFLFFFSFCVKRELDCNNFDFVVSKNKKMKTELSPPPRFLTSQKGQKKNISFPSLSLSSLSLLF